MANEPLRYGIWIGPNGVQWNAPRTCLLHMCVLDGAH